MERARKRVLFCQGDKRELEEITGEAFDYIRLPETYHPDDESRFQGRYGPTFLEVNVYVGKDKKMDLDTARMNLLDDELMRVEADAFIHYQCGTTTHQDVVEAWARGTPVRRKNQ